MQEKKIEIASQSKLIERLVKLKPYLIKIWNKKYSFILINLFLNLLFVLYLLFLVEPTFETNLTILPEYGSKSTYLSQLGELASLAGVKVGEAAPTEIYKNIIFSEVVLEQVVYAKYQTKKFPHKVNLIEYFKIKTDNSLPLKLQERYKFIKLYDFLIKKRIEANVERTTKILTLRVIMPESVLASEVANNIVESLDNYIKTKRKSYAFYQRDYLEKRISQVRDSLNNAEDRLRLFREKNRIVINSPTLILEQGRLVRSAEILQTVYIELNKQFELAKIDEIKNTPVINLKESAKEPLIKTGPQRVMLAIFFGLIILILTSIYYIFQESIKGNLIQIKRALK